MLFLPFAAIAQQDTVSWVGLNHPSYSLQQSPDNYTWKTISEIPGTSDSNYVATIPGATYYYRVVADSDTSNCIYVYNEVLAIDTVSVFHPKPKPKEFKVYVSGENIMIESQKDEYCSIAIYNVLGQLLRSVETFLKRGLNTYQFPADGPHGIYIIQVKTAYNKITEKIFR